MSEPTTSITVPTATPTPPPAQADAPPAAAPAQETDWKAEARKWEDRAKANRAELDAREQAIADSQKTAEQKAADAEAKASTATLEALRFKVALDKGLPITLAVRLTGSSQEELEADADALMALIPQAQTEAPPAPPVGPTVPGQQPGGTSPAALVTQADLDALAAANKYGEINRLRREGRLTHLGVAPPKA